MSLNDPVVLTCSISGSLADRAQCPAIPYTPAEYAAEARRIVDEGGVHIHIHARSPDGKPSYEIEDFAAISDAIRSEVGDAAIINFSTGALGVPVEQRIAYLEACRPEVAALNMGSMNYAKYNPAKKKFVFDFVFPNPFAEIIALVSAMKECRVKPEMECFDSGHIGNSFPLIDMGLLAPPYQYSLIMGVLGGIPPTVETLVQQARLLPLQSDWEVIGISDDQWRMVAAAIALGGNVRVGLEDNFYVAPGVMAGSNGELVEKAARMVRDQGRQVATIEECRGRLGLVHV